MSADNYHDDDSYYCDCRMEFYKELVKQNDPLVTCLPDLEKTMINDLFRRYEESSDESEESKVRAEFKGWWNEFNTSGLARYGKDLWERKLTMLPYVGTSWWNDGLGYIRLSEGIKLRFTGFHDSDPPKLKALVEEFWDKRVHRSYYITESSSGANSGFILERTRDGTKLFIGTFNEPAAAYAANPELWVQIDNGLELLLNHKERRRLRRYLAWCGERPVKI